jgi:multiple sugar transport system substrate-binding protein
LQLALSILNNTPELAPRLGIALPPGPSYVGGSSLVIWKHSRHEDQAVDLVQHLLGQQAQYDYCLASGNLPVRRETLASPPYTDDPVYHGFVQAIEKGRTFPVFRLSGLVEERLATTLAQVWAELAQNPPTVLAELLGQFLKPTAGRLRSVLQ